MNTYPIEHEGRTFTPDGAIPAVARPGDRLGCGHRCPDTHGSIFPGYAIRNGRTMCKWCANRAERRDFARSTVFVGYISGQPWNARITTWLGAPLAKITRHQVSGRIWTPTGGTYRLVTIRAEAPDGSQWYGRGSDNWQAIRLRRYTTAPRWDR